MIRIRRLTTDVRPPRRALAWGLAAALGAGVAACGDRAETPADPAPAAPEAPAPTEAPSPAAAAGPRLSPGLWRITTTGADDSSALQVCLDDAIQERLAVVGGQVGGGCEPETAIRTPGGWKTRAVCDLSGMGGGRTEIQTDVTGDMTRTYASRSSATTTGAAVPHMNRTVSTTAQGVRQGDCPADMRPGDVAIEGGPRFNMAEMAEMAARLRAPAG